MNTITPQPQTISLADIYRFLAASMRYPECVWLDQAYLSFLSALLHELGRQEEAAALSALASDPSWLETVQSEYTRLFINAVPHVKAPPYGSVYLGREGSLYGPSAERVRQCYHAQGFDLAAAGEMPDHLVYELEFLALLHAGNRVQEAELFLHEHVLPWFPRFRDQVLTETQQPFYRVLVRLIDFFTRAEEEQSSANTFP